MRIRTLLLALVVAGCGVDPPPEATPVAPEPSPAEPAAEPSPAEPVAPDAAPAVLALDAEGFRFVDAESGSTRLLPFGTPGDQAIAAVARLRGAPGQRGTNTECGAGPLDIVSWPDGLSMLLADGRFVGWAANEVSAAGRAATTMAGLGVGSTRADLDGAYTARISESTLGTEFEAGDLYGVLDGPGTDARVTALWAGVSCVFR